MALPVIAGNRLFISTGYSTGCVLLVRTPWSTRASRWLKRLWANKEMKNYFSTSLLVDGYLYGSQKEQMRSASDFRTGKAKWSTGGFNRGSLIAADGKLIVYGAAGLSGPGRNLFACRLQGACPIQILRRNHMDRTDIVRRPVVSRGTRRIWPV